MSGSHLDPINLEAMSIWNQNIFESNYFFDQNFGMGGGLFSPPKQKQSVSLILLHKHVLGIFGPKTYLNQKFVWTQDGC